MSEGGSFETCRILVACDPLWGLGYERDACYADDPWLAYAVRHTEPLRASEFSCLSDRQRAVVGLAESFGFRSVVVVPAPTAGFALSCMLVLWSKLEGYFEGDGYPALKVLGRSLAMSLHECYIALIARELRATSRLSDEDLRLLACERQGLGTKSIARLSGVSCEAIDTRFRRLNAKLHVPNRTEAARLAEEFGLI
jgi:DNA-binding CsgD family transcriptional regulator